MNRCPVNHEGGEVDENDIISQMKWVLSEFMKKVEFHRVSVRQARREYLEKEQNSGILIANADPVQSGVLAGLVFENAVEFMDLDVEIKDDEDLPHLRRAFLYSVGGAMERAIRQGFAKMQRENPARAVEFEASFGFDRERGLRYLEKSFLDGMAFVGEMVELIVLMLWEEAQQKEGGLRENLSVEDVQKMMDHPKFRQFIIQYANGGRIFENGFLQANSVGCVEEMLGVKEVTPISTLMPSKFRFVDDENGRFVALQEGGREAVLKEMIEFIYGLGSPYVVAKEIKSCVAFAVELPEGGDLFTISLDQHIALLRNGMVPLLMERLYQYAETGEATDFFVLLPEAVELQLIGPRSMGEKSEKGRSRYSDERYYAPSSLRAEVSASWADLTAYCDLEISDSEFAGIVADNLARISGLEIKQKDLVVVRSRRKVLDVLYSGKNQSYPITVWVKNNGEWELERREINLKSRRNEHLILPPAADMGVRIPMDKVSTRDRFQVWFNNSSLKLPIDYGAVMQGVEGRMSRLAGFVDKWVPQTGKSYRDFSNDKAPEVSEALQELAKKVVGNAGSREEKVQKVFDFVTQCFGYANATSFVVPEIVVLNGVGDCDEKARLASYLLSAVGVDSYLCAVDVTSRGSSEVGKHAMLGVTGNFGNREIRSFTHEGRRIYLLEVAVSRERLRLGEASWASIGVRGVHHYYAQED